jgi:Glycosyltransferase
VDRAKLRLLMRAADVLLYPTLADNHPLVLLEAAAMELSVVSFAAGGVPEIVLHDETGLLTPVGDEPGFLSASRSLLADPALSRRLGQAARAHGAKRFTAARMAADYAVLFDVTAVPQAPATK